MKLSARKSSEQKNAFPTLCGRWPSQLAHHMPESLWLCGVTENEKIEHINKYKQNNMEYIIAIVIGLLLGGGIGFAMRQIFKSRFDKLTEQAAQEAEVMKEKKLLEVKEKFLNKKAELDREAQAHNQKMQQAENRMKQREQAMQQNRTKPTDANRSSTTYKIASHNNRRPWSSATPSWTRCRSKNSRN